MVKDYDSRVPQEVEALSRELSFPPGRNILYVLKDYYPQELSYEDIGSKLKERGIPYRDLSSHLSRMALSGIINESSSKDYSIGCIYSITELTVINIDTLSSALKTCAERVGFWGERKRPRQKDLPK
jgi:hypothetical protein